MSEVSTIKGHRLVVQSEEVYGEGRWWYLICCSCPSSCDLLRKHSSVTSDEIGPGARQRVLGQRRRIEKEEADDE